MGPLEATQASGVRMIGPGFEVPANVSRLFEDAGAARSQPTATIQLAYSQDDPYIFNLHYRADLIGYDDNYCTSVVDLAGVTQLPTLAHLDRVRTHLPADPTVLDIGCGQGEFVLALRSQGLRAVGFDPACRTTSPHLHRSEWFPGAAAADLYVMRCVLPHIPEPWTFLDSLASAAPRALVLIEFQRLEWLIEQGIWQQVSHDHVNLFADADFSSRYEVVDQGQWAQGEWGWVLVNPSARPHGRAALHAHPDEVESMMAHRGDFERWVGRARGTIVIWGAAGKGSMLAFVASRAAAEAEVVAVDADPHRWGRYLEASGVLVHSPDQVREGRFGDPLVVVANPNHFDQVRAFLVERFTGRLLTTANARAAAAP